MEAVRVQLAMVKALRAEMAAASTEEKLKLLPELEGALAELEAARPARHDAGRDDDRASCSSA